jgi:hypothetical protein
MKQRQAQITIDAAIGDKHLLGAALGGNPKTWSTWRIILKAAFGLSLNEAELATFASVAGSRTPPTKRVRELWAVCGRRSGKSRIAAACAVYIACFTKHKLAQGEVGVVLCLAASQDQAQVVFRYMLAFLESSPILKQEIVSSNKSEIVLRNGVVLSVHSTSFRTIRGRTLLGCIFDECAFWRDEASAVPDIETYRAVLPSLATTQGLLIGISSPYRRTGLLGAKYRDFYDVSSDEVLIVRGATATFNPTLSEETIATQMQADPVAGASEWLAEFRSDLSSFLDDETVDAAIDHGRPLELPPRPGASYEAFTDASGGSGKDSYTLAIAHREGDLFVIDCLRGTQNGVSFDPQSTTEEYAQLCKQYRCHRVTGDYYSAGWVTGAWQKAGISYTVSDIPKSQIYLESLPLFNRNVVRLPDHPRLLRELRLLERQTHRTGKDSVDHPRNGSDDFANSVCGCLRVLSNPCNATLSWLWIGGGPNAQSDAKREAEEWQRWRTQSYFRSLGIPVR